MANDPGLSTKLVRLIAASPQGIDTSALCEQLAKTPQELGDIFENLVESGEAIGLAGLWLSEKNWKIATTKVEDVLKNLHSSHPAIESHEAQSVWKAAGFNWPAKQVDRASRKIAESTSVVYDGTGLRLVVAQLKLSERQKRFIERVVAELDASGYSTPNPHKLGKSLGTPIQAVEEILRIGHLSGHVVFLEDGVCYSRKQVEELKVQLKEVSAGKAFTAGEVRDWLGISRRYVVPLLELFDREQFTVRTDDSRVIR